MKETLLVANISNILTSPESGKKLQMEFKSILRTDQSVSN